MNESTTTESTAEAGGSSLERLVMRFEEMAKVRESLAADRRIAGDSTFLALESAAAAYRRCADEVRRVANCETPAEPGYRWD